MLPVAGLISARGFLSCLGRGVFLSTQYMRHHSRPLYTPEPDVIHELIGHATSFFDPDYVRLSQLFGQAAPVADAPTLARLERVYWYTLEFGLARERDEVKAYGAGLLSSYGELGGFESRSKLEPFDLEKVSRTPYDPTSYQKVLFVVPSFRQMAREVGAWLERSPGGAPSRSAPLRRERVGVRGGPAGLSIMMVPSGRPDEPPMTTAVTERRSRGVEPRNHPKPDGHRPPAGRPTSPDSEERSGDRPSPDQGGRTTSA